MEHKLVFDKEDLVNHDFMGGCSIGDWYMTALSRQEIVEEFKNHRSMHDSSYNR